jgi:uncharacterized protein (DUF1697 family)
MPTFISILRGINVSGHRVIKMEALKMSCGELGFQNIRTYIQSGNLVFESALADTNAISESIHGKILDAFGYDVPVITMTIAELEQVVLDNPFSNDKSKDPSCFHVAFLSEVPSPQRIEKLNEAELNNDAFALVDKAVYLYCPDGYSNSKLTNALIEKKLKVIATTRNWKTTNVLLKMATC